MAENNKSTVKMFLPAIVLVASLRYSVLFTMGIVIGYILCKIFCNVFVKNGKVDSIFIDYGKWKVHLHHWIIGIIILAIVWVIDYLYLPTFFAGAICGVIIQDIYDYNDWHKVIIKNDDCKKDSKA
jgi:Na+/glutamate symporter